MYHAIVISGKLKLRESFETKNEALIYLRAVMAAVKFKTKATIRIIHD